MADNWGSNVLGELAGEPTNTANPPAGDVVLKSKGEVVAEDSSTLAPDSAGPSLVSSRAASKNLTSGAGDAPQTDDIKQETIKPNATSELNAFFEEDEDGATSPTYRHGIMGEHFQVPANMVKSSSKVAAQSLEEPGFHWKTKGKENEWAIYDFGEPTTLTEVNVRLTGTDGTNPQCIIISHLQMNEEDPMNLDGPFVTVKRIYVPENARKVHIAWRQDEPAQFWKIQLPNNWTGSHMVLSDVQFIAEDSDTRKRTAGLKTLSKQHSMQLGKLATVFDESSMLDDQQRDDRRIARSLGIPLTESDILRQKFDKYDVDGSGQIDKEEFCAIIGEIMGVKDPSSIPQDRFDQYWREIDQDQSGEVDFEEFLVWYQQVVKSNALNPESFYATFGVKRMSRNAKAAAANAAASPADSVTTGQ